MEIIKTERGEEIRFTQEEHKLLDWAIAEIVAKYTAASGDQKEVNTDHLDFFLCGLLRREGEAAVRMYVEEYCYKPRE
ncbi:MAG TPA: hypothetical protein DEB10_08240 [Ruminococcaceae bacterium]|jgi:hypothetical protein|nr:hypothetical protein [Oscillospiraceae bacterium]